MKIDINNSDDLKKVLAFAKTHANVVFKLINKDFSWLAKELAILAKEHGVKLEIVKPTDEQVKMFVAAGAAIGIGAGYLVAGLPGIFIGAAIGATGGYAVSHVRITIDPAHNTFQLQS